MADEPQSVPEEIPNEFRQISDQPGVPQFYTDGLLVASSPFTATLTFTLDTIQGRRPVGEVRMSPAHAKLAVIMLKRILKDAESKWGMPIMLPEGMLKERDIDLEREW